MLALINTAQLLLVHYLDTTGKTGVTGLSVSINIRNATGLLLVTGGICSELGDGLYGYSYTPTAQGTYPHVFKTSSALVQQQDIPAVLYVKDWTQYISDILADTGILTGGAGSRAVTIQLYETSTTTPIVDAQVAAYNAGGDLMASALSNASGQVVFALADGAHTVRLRKAGVTFAIEAITVSGSGSFTLYGTPTTITAPTISNVCRVYEFAFDQAGALPLADVHATAKINTLPFDYNGVLHDGSVIEASTTTPDEAGKYAVYWDLPYTAVAVVILTEHGVRHQITVPAQTTARVADLIDEETE